ncbi:hypothetical protein [Tenacibaculum maritimum]|uniref:hypothetical protein n=1 Tax=Tenacibaculum maritimum TaxID=107401 RepID=UPI0012E54939|nr:hypothetical protein [Tenacibaculum maritimum]CAA0202638.1 conserved hypothetical protein [Tenacibaculum maritimum]CAA0251943.1 conserved hypothetical protein [Tenacibaculum maritimum]
MIVGIFKHEILIGTGYFKKIVNIKKDKFNDLMIELSNCSFKKKVQLSKGESIALKVNLTESQFDIINLILLEGIQISKAIKFKAKLNQSEFNSFELYSPSLYNFFLKWGNNYKIDWRDLNTELEKEAWIRACSRLIDITKHKLNRKKYIIDFEYVNSLLDFYCLIGETFLGYKGYMGGDGNAFLDCLSFIRQNKNDDSEIFVMFKNFHLINKRFKNNLDLLKEFKTNIIDDFENNGFIIDGAE